jgi:hypothetical protein
MIASLYEAFAPEKARSLARRLETRHTPKHGSWLDIAEIEINSVTRQCLSRRIDNRETLRSELAAWETHRNMRPKFRPFPRNVCLARRPALGGH